MRLIDLYSFKSIDPHEVCRQIRLRHLVSALGIVTGGEGFWMMLNYLAFKFAEVLQVSDKTVRYSCYSGY